MVFAQAFQDYKNNLITACAFGLLLVFVPLFSSLSNILISSGSVVVDYGFLRLPFFESFLLLFLVLVFLFLYSLLTCLLVFAVRADFNKVKLHYFLSEKVLVFAFRYFNFVAVFTLVSVLISFFLVDLGLPVFVINIFLVLFSLPFLFLPQAIVIDGESLRGSLLNAFEFSFKNFGSFSLVFFFGLGSVFVLQLFEFLLDYFFGVGGFISLIVALMFLVPFFEALKTEVYLSKVSLFSPYREKLV
ncbi:MAG: hypothetical protein QXU92_01810 [Candidatus Diapherotrites archaeon]